MLFRSTRAGGHSRAAGCCASDSRCRAGEPRFVRRKRREQLAGAGQPAEQRVELTVPARATTGATRITRLEGRAMGVTCAVTVTGPDGFDSARRALEDISTLEALWTRFSPHSDVSRMNRSAGRPVYVAPDTITLVATMLEAHRATRGLFDPTMLPEQLAAGDSRSLVDIGATESVPAAANHDLGSIRILDGCTVVLPEGMALDAGGIGKGLAADLIADRTVANGAEGVCVNIGGDLACRGIPPEGGDRKSTRLNSSHSSVSRMPSSA